MDKKLRVVSLFSGIGGFEFGIKQSTLNFEVVFASEIDKYAQISYIENFGSENLYGDITTINANEIPDHDILCAGFPCQAFSIAGNQKGFEDIRGTLFFDIVRILKEKKPKYILLENVKNIISHDKGKTFRTIIDTLNKVGYTVDFTIINSNEAGLPQNRERTFIVGILQKEDNRILSDRRSKKIDEFKRNYYYKGFNFFDELNYNNPNKFIKDIISNDIESKYYISNSNVIEFLKENKFEYGEYKNQIVKLFDLPRDVWNDLERQRRVYSINGISPTILARSDTTKIYIKDNKNAYIRKITPRESFRAQGFGEKFIDNILHNKKISITQQYKQAGNAVSPPVIVGIINHLKIFMEE
ncbi:MAG: DNA (cytosine-5-)-methyltransferase [Peptostreptococcaceae bacterium]